MITQPLAMITCVSRMPGRVQPTIWVMERMVTTMTQMARSPATIQVVTFWALVVSAA